MYMESCLVGAPFAACAESPRGAKETLETSLIESAETAARCNASCPRARSRRGAWRWSRSITVSLLLSAIQLSALNAVAEKLETGRAERDGVFSEFPGALTDLFPFPNSALKRVFGPEHIEEQVNRSIGHRDDLDLMQRIGAAVAKAQSAGRISPTRPTLYLLSGYDGSVASLNPQSPLTIAVDANPFWSSRGGDVSPRVELPGESQVFRYREELVSGFGTAQCPARESGFKTAVDTGSRCIAEGLLASLRRVVGPSFRVLGIKVAQVNGASSPNGWSEGDASIHGSIWFHDGVGVKQYVHLNTVLGRDAPWWVDQLRALNPGVVAFRGSMDAFAVDPPEGYKKVPEFWRELVAGFEPVIVEGGRLHGVGTEFTGSLSAGWQLKHATLVPLKRRPSTDDPPLRWGYTIREAGPGRQIWPTAHAAHVARVQRAAETRMSCRARSR